MSADVVNGDLNASLVQRQRNRSSSTPNWSRPGRLDTDAARWWPDRSPTRKPVAHRPQRCAAGAPADARHHRDTPPNCPRPPTRRASGCLSLADVHAGHAGRGADVAVGVSREGTFRGSYVRLSAAQTSSASLPSEIRVVDSRVPLSVWQTVVVADRFGFSVGRCESLPVISAKQVN